MPLCFHFCIFQVYKDASPLFIQHSCSHHCPSDFNKKSSFIDGVKELEKSLEKEISNTEKFLASNEKIEENLKLQQDEEKFMLNDAANKLLDIEIDRSSLQEMTRMKDLLNLKYGAEKEVFRNSSHECKLCPKFEEGKLFELYLRFPKELVCVKENSCGDKFSVEIKATLVKEKIDCANGYLMSFPLDTNNKCSPELDTKNLISRCVRPTCNVKVPHKHLKLTKKDMLKARHSAKLLQGGNDEAFNVVRNNTEELFITVPETVGESSCVWFLNTANQKHVQLKASPSLLNYITVFESNSFEGNSPLLNLKYCSQTQFDSYWFATSAPQIVIVYDNKFPLQAPAEIQVNVRLCPEPPVVDYASVSILYR